MNPFDVPSPCINICKIDEPSQRCMGCARTIDEITRWSGMDNDEKQAVMDATIMRRQLEKKSAQHSDKNAIDEQSRLTPRQDNSAESDNTQ